MRDKGHPLYSSDLDQLRADSRTGRQHLHQVHARGEVFELKDLLQGASSVGPAAERAHRPAAQVVDGDPCLGAGRKGGGQRDRVARRIRIHSQRR